MQAAAPPSAVCQLTLQRTASLFRVLAKFWNPPRSFPHYLIPFSCVMSTFAHLSRPSLSSLLPNPRCLEKIIQKVEDGGSNHHPGHCRRHCQHHRCARENDQFNRRTSSPMAVRGPHRHDTRVSARRANICVGQNQGVGRVWHWRDSLSVVHATGPLRRMLSSAGRQNRF